MTADSGSVFSIIKANPQRRTGLEDCGQLPSIMWVHRFAERQSLVLRKSSTISKGRAVISPNDILMWFTDVGKYLEDKPYLLEALGDPNHIFNQNETAVELGVGDQWVLAPRNTKQVYSVSSSTREHVTISYTVNAAGGMVSPRIVFAGVRDIAKIKLVGLPEDGSTGKWLYSYTDNGWMKQSTYIYAMEDLVKYIKENKIKTPVLYFIDGASCHLSLEMAEFCNKHGIQPILLCPNTTHLTQALD